MITITKGKYQELNVDKYTVDELPGINEPNKVFAAEDRILNEFCKCTRAIHNERYEIYKYILADDSCCEHYCYNGILTEHQNITCFSQYRCYCDENIVRRSYMILKNKTVCCVLITMRQCGAVNITAFPGYYDNIVNFIDVINKKRMSICVDDVQVYSVLASVLASVLRFKNFQVLDGRIIVNDTKYKRITQLTDVIIIH